MFGLKKRTYTAPPCLAWLSGPVPCEVCCRNSAYHEVIGDVGSPLGARFAVCPLCVAAGSLVVDALYSWFWYQAFDYLCQRGFYQCVTCRYAGSGLKVCTACLSTCCPAHSWSLADDGPEFQQSELGQAVTEVYGGDARLCLDCRSIRSR